MANDEHLNDIVRIPPAKLYPPDKNRLIPWIEFNNEPGDYSWRRYRVLPIEGYNTRYPSETPLRVRLKEEDLIITRTYDHINPNIRG